jgi:hypothetical protein
VEVPVQFRIFFKTSIGTTNFTRYSDQKKKKKK